MLLKLEPTVTALVAGRIFSGVLPQTVTFPAIAYRPFGGRKVVRTLSGGIALVEEAYHVFSADKGLGHFGVATELDRAVNVALDEFSGTIVDTSSLLSPPDSMDVQIIYSGDICHEYEYDDKLQLHQFVSEFRVHYLDPLRIPASP